MFALTLSLFLVGVVALVVDVGHFWEVRGELQNAADSAALAGARDLDGTSAKFPVAVQSSRKYAGYMLSHLAFVLMNPTWWNLLMYGICDALQIPRLLAEERLLTRDASYRRYRSTVRYRLFPGIY